MLLNWAVRAGHLPIFVDLDVSQNLISLPGTISALAVERTALVDEGGGGFNIDAQICYHFGYKTPNENPVLYRRLVTVLKEAICIRSEQISASSYLFECSFSVLNFENKSLKTTQSLFRSIQRSNYKHVRMD